MTSLSDVGLYMGCETNRRQEVMPLHSGTALGTLINGMFGSLI